MGMTYDSYKKRLETLASIKASIIKHRLLIIACLIVALTIVSVFLGINGLITDVELNKAEYTYGEDVGFFAKSIFNKTNYEYHTLNGQWQEGLPQTPGEYEIRAVSNRSFGAKEYSKASKVVIKKKDLYITIKNDSIVYGNSIYLNAELSFKDRLICEQYDVDYIDDKTINMTPDLDTLQILNSEGKDVKNAYNIIVESKQINYTKQNITIKTDDLSKTYDGKEEVLDKARITSGKLGYGDKVVVTPKSFGLTAGRFTNNSESKIVNKDGEDVTYRYYNPTFTFGYVDIAKINIEFKTKNATKVYDSQPLTNETVLYDESLIPSGEGFIFSNFASITNVGTTYNYMQVSANANTNLNNYSITVNYGQLKVEEQEIIIKTGSASKVFDNNALAVDSYEILAGTLYGGDYLVKYANLGYVIPGTYDNPLNFYVKQQNGSISGNYLLTIKPGTIQIDKINIKVKTSSQTKEYDGMPLYTGGAIPTPLNTNSLPSSKFPQLDTTILDGWDVSAPNEAWLKDESVPYYEITETDFGTLRITKRDIEIRVLSSSVTYNGEEQIPQIEYDTNRLLPDSNDIVFVDLYAKTDAGVYQTDISDIGVGLEIRAGGSRYYVYQDYYNIIVPQEYSKATFTINKKALNLSLLSFNGDYDGLKHSPAFSTSGLCTDHILRDVVFDNYQTRVGACQSKIISLRISSIFDDTKDFTANYDLGLDALSPVEVRVNVKTIVITPIHEEIIYDRQYHQPSKDYQITNGKSLAQEDRIVVSQVYGSFRDIGTYKTWIQAADIYAGDTITPNRDCYNLVFGEDYKEDFVINKRPIVISPQYVEAQFDKQEHKPTDIDILGSGLLEGDHVVNVTIDGSRTEIGETESSISSIIDILDANNVSVKDVYNITYAKSAIKIIPRVLKIITGSKEKIYDGEPLKYDHYRLDTSVFENPVFEGDIVEVTVIGQRTNIGQSPNHAVVRAYFANPSYYTVTFEVGTLTVVDPAGGGGEGEGYGDEPLIIAAVQSSEVGAFYLKSYSYSQYQGRVFDIINPESIVLDGSHTQEYITGTNLKNIEAQANSMIINSFTYMPFRPYYLSTDTEHLMDGDLIDLEQSVDGYSFSHFITQTDVAIRLDNHLTGVLANNEVIYRDYVNANFLTLEEGRLKTYLNSIIVENGFTKEDPAIISKVAKFIQSSAKYNMDYDKSLDSESDVVIAFLRDYKEGVCRHYATAATMLYRALGIPARFIGGAYVYIDEANKITTITDKNLHAWVEVYIEGVGWVMVEVTAPDGRGSGGAGGSGSGSGGEGGESGEGGEAGEGEIVPGNHAGIKDYYSVKNLYIHPVRTYAKYNGTELVAKNEVETESGHGLFEMLLSQGYTYSCEVYGKRTEVGTSESEIRSFRLFNKKGEDVTEKYNIITSKGEVIVTSKDIIELMVYASSRSYNGQKYEVDYYYYNYNYEIVAATKPSNVYRVELIDTLETLNAGIVYGRDLEQNAHWIVKNYSNQDVTNNYVVFIKGIALQTNPKVITITTNSFKQIVGDEIVGRYANVTQGYLQNGDRIECTFKEIQVTIGEPAYNEIEELKIIDSNNQDVTMNYSIRLIMGTIEFVEHKTTPI
ncbi:MAG: transglutaminase domain-containing protein [Clostridiales bacterium]|nr:transglutaminase domain-containing protein [Clostridiales bacterium]